ncbi:MAG: ACT domain-containing protein, partial [Candidatus Bathyarchaeota archaeon]
LGGGDYTRKLVILSDQEPYVDESISGHCDEIDITKSSGSLVGIVGKNMEESPGIISRMGGALAKKGINIYYQFDVSPISCGVIVDRSQAEEAVEMLYEEFKLSSY